MVWAPTSYRHRASMRPKGGGCRAGPTCPRVMQNRFDGIYPSEVFRAGSERGRMG